MERTTKAQLESMAGRLAKALGEPVTLDYAPVYGGYYVLPLDECGIFNPGRTSARETWRRMQFAVATLERAEATRAAATAISERLEYLRGELYAERISYGELAELESLREHISPDDFELLEAAGVPEHCDECGLHVQDGHMPHCSMHNIIEREDTAC